MIRVGITGHTGFIGHNLSNYLLKYPTDFRCIYCDTDYFSSLTELRGFVRQCDVIIHLAGICRSPRKNEVYNTNMRLIQALIEAVKQERVVPYIIFSSSIQEGLESEYGRSKRDGFDLFEKWASRYGGSLTGLVLPNVFGAYAKPDHTSFIATFCCKLLHNEQPAIINDKRLGLLYIDTLCRYIKDKIHFRNKDVVFIEKVKVPYDFEAKVSEVLAILESFKSHFIDRKIMPHLSTRKEEYLFETFCSYIDYQS